MAFGDYIVFADESGDHGMESIDPEFPLFSLVFCIFEKDVYLSEVEPALRAFKFKWFGHDAVVLHEREIRKQLPPFDLLRRDRAARGGFFDELTELMAGVRMQVYAAVIDKERHRARYTDPWNPYQVAMHFLMEKLCSRLMSQGQKGRFLHVLFEGRGKSEDQDLELEFRRIAAGQAEWGWKRVPFNGFRTRLRPQGRQLGGAPNQRSYRSPPGTAGAPTCSAQPRRGRDLAAGE